MLSYAFALSRWCISDYRSMFVGDIWTLYGRFVDFVSIGKVLLFHLTSSCSLNILVIEIV